MKFKKSIISAVAFATLAVSAGASASAQEYEVEKGDTLWGISQEFGTTVDELKTWNNLSSHLIYPDQELTVSSKEFYTVKKGDTLWEVSSRYGITIDSLKAWNALDTDIIQPGQELIINLDEKTKQTETAEVTKSKVEPKSEPVQTKATPVQAEEKITSEEKTVKDTEQQEEVEKELTVEATAYTASCEGCSGVTATGINLKDNPDKKVISVDPNVIPLGSKVHVEGYGYATAADTGGAIKGNKIDVFIPSKEQANDWGRRSVNVKVLH
jgi:3D (Asp-Asp-Asp) domain-containing protein